MKKIHKNNERDYYLSVEEYTTLDSSEKTEWIPLAKKYERIPIWCIVALSFGAICGVLYFIFCISPDFADFFNLYISGFIRMILAKITGVLPFSIAEACIILIPVFLFLIIRHIWKYRCNTGKSTLVTMLCILSVVSIFLSQFVICFSAGYRGRELDEKLGIEAKEVSKQELYDSAVYLVGEINALVPQIKYGEDHLSIMPYSLATMNDKLIDAYDSFSEKNDFIWSFDSHLKPVLLSEWLSYMHITGVYTFVTGEANINIAFPDYTTPSTAAHELSHQRGIAREDEANFLAFLVCIGSDDAYIRYSAYVNLYEYVAAALASADYSLYQRAVATLPSSVIGEQIAYSAFFEKYRDSAASEVSETVNNTFLVIHGTEGTKSYGMVVDLCVAYYK